MAAVFSSGQAGPIGHRGHLGHPGCSGISGRVRRRLGQGLLAAVLPLVLAACGGGLGNGSTSGNSSSALAAAEDGLKRALAAVVPSTVPADAHLKGMWGPVYSWPIIPIHTVLMPDGRLLTYGSKADGFSTGFFGVDVWDNAGNPDVGHQTFANSTGTDLFCSSQLLLPPASTSSVPSVFIAGGDIWSGSANTFVGNSRSTVFDAGSNTVQRGSDMTAARWYSTSLTLVNGETYIQGGSGGQALPEVRQLDGSFRRLSTADTSFLIWSYPRNFVMPDSRVFGYDFEGRMYFVNTAGTGGVSARSILPLQYFGAGTAAMFRPGRILQVGGNSNASAIIDVTSGNPVFTPTQSTSTVRKLATATLLPDGQVVITGGSPAWNELLGANRAAEIWNPITGQWTAGAEGARVRLYHSMGILLPDATVMVGGGGAPAPQGADPGGERNVEVYYPPYLFTPAGTRAARPVISQAPDWLEIGKTFRVNASAGISRVTLVKTGSVTHGFNMDQRFLDLPFTRTAVAGGDLLAVNGPARPGEATPGYYMLFVFDSAGVPSVARVLRMGVAGPVNTALAPSITNPGNLSGTVNIATTRQVSATDPNGDALVYSAAGLPPGLQINPSTGLVSGTPTAAGNFNVVVAVSDGTYTHSASLVWSIAATTQLTLTVLPTPAETLAGGIANFAAVASGLGVQYAWNFGDGSPTTAFSSSATANKTYTTPGIYTVTLTVRDGTGATLTRSFLQTVYMGNGDKPSRAGSNMVLASPFEGSDKLWVVNPDNDSITGFDTLTNAKLGEVAVGAGPRNIAVDAQRLLWVSNKAAATISIVDPIARSVLRTIALPRGSQPHGLVISPVAQQAFVVLEATGQLLRFDTATFAQTGALAVGPNVRHVSVLGNGSAVYVSRFITPPLPGEATAAPVPGNAGGEVLQVDAQAMTLVRTIVLGHASKPDAENQGSGVPNYLGPVSISPDGTLAYVPGKQDNILRGQQRNGLPLNFQNTVRAISSRIVIKGAGANAEAPAARIDHDNASLATAVAYDRRGVYLFVALETSREVAVLDAHTGTQFLRFDVGRAPQGLLVSADGYTLFVSNFMDRTVSVHDLRPLINQGLATVPALATLSAVASERLSAQVLLGKQLFYDARDTRLARDRYMSCATCHSDGGHDGRVWDFGSLGEGLRNTVALNGRAGMGHGRLHWSNNFDEVQDFEGQIRTLAGGTGLMSDAQFTTGTRSQPLGDRKAGVSADLDALAAYVGSLSAMAPSPWRPGAAGLSPAAAVGKQLFANLACASCHSGGPFTRSALDNPADIGTLKPASGQRLGGPLAGIDVPTLRDVWATAPYLHDGSAPTLEAAVLTHRGLGATAADARSLAAYLREIGGDEPAAPVVNPGNQPPTVALTAPAANATVTAGVALTVSATAADADGSVTRVEFYDGATLIGTATVAPYVVPWANPSAGAHSLSARAFDNAGASTTSAAVAITASPPAVVPPAGAVDCGLEGGTCTLPAGVVATVYYGANGQYALKTGVSGALACNNATFGDPIVGTLKRCSYAVTGSTSAGQGGGLLGRYFANNNLSGAAVLQRTEAVNFNWGRNAPDATLPADNFSVRWTGSIETAFTGAYLLQTNSDDGVRVWVNGGLVINNWTSHGPTLDTSAVLNAVAGRRYSIVVEYKELTGGALLQLRWQLPGATVMVPVPASALYAN